MFPLLSHPRAQPGVVDVLVSNAHSFLIVTQKFQLQINYTLAVIVENVTFSGILISIFLYIFITVSSLVSHFYFCPRRENKKQP